VSEKQQQSYTHGFPNNKSEEKVAFLAQSAIFRQLDVTRLHDIERFATVVTYAPGRILYRPGERGMTLFLLVSGVVHLYHLSTDGRKLITATPEIGSCFGEVALLDNETHSSFAEVIKEARICIISKHDIEQLATQTPSVMTALLKSAGHHFTQLEAQLVNTTFKSMNARLATLLLQLAQETHIVDGLSHEELAEHLGTYRETVSVALRDLKETGIIELGRRHITICNKSLLQEIAGS
jgi:CRP-like cAMP-binding protein